MQLFFFLLIIRRPPIYTLFPYTTLFRSQKAMVPARGEYRASPSRLVRVLILDAPINLGNSGQVATEKDRKSTRLNSSHTVISYAVFCLKKKKKMLIYNRNYIIIL